MPFQPIVPAGTAAPLAPYSMGARAGNVVYTAGIVAVDAQGNLVGKGDARTQTRQVLDTISAVLASAGGSLSDVAFVQIFLATYDDYAAMNEVYRTYFPENPPARFCIRADLVKPEFLVEIAATAHLA